VAALSMRIPLVLTEADSHLGLTNRDRKSTRLNSSHMSISYAVFCLKKKKMTIGNVENMQIPPVVGAEIIEHACAFLPRCGPSCAPTMSLGMAVATPSCFFFKRSGYHQDFPRSPTPPFPY